MEKGGEREGIFPASVSFTRDLHSLGQLIQEGRRNLFHLWVENPAADTKIFKLAEDTDSLNYLSGKTLHFVNEMACQGAMAAHASGGVPTLKITVPGQTPFITGS